MPKWAAEAQFGSKTWIWKGLIGQMGSVGKELRHVWSSVSVQLILEIRVKWGQTPLRKTKTYQRHWVMTRGVGTVLCNELLQCPRMGGYYSSGYTLLQGLQAFRTRGLASRRNWTADTSESLLSLVGRRPWCLIRHRWSSKGSCARKIGAVLSTKLQVGKV